MSVRVVGVAASRGVAIGPAYVLGGRLDVRERRVTPAAVAAEIERLDRALDETEAQLQLAERQVAQLGGGAQEFLIFEAHRMMLRDPHLADEARKLVREELAAAEFAVQIALDRIRALFDRVSDPYFAERRGDIDLVGERLLRRLLGLDARVVDAIPPGSVVVAYDLAPADVAQLGRAGAVGACTDGGGKSSHTTIVARALGMPYVVGAVGGSGLVRAGQTVIVDGARGVLIVDPTPEELEQVTSRLEQERARAQTLGRSRSEPAATRCGARVGVSANVELLDQIPSAVGSGAGGIGLFRTEFLYLDRPDLPSEDEQMRHAVAAARGLPGRPATFRTLDLGGDKMPPAFRVPSGANPVLGLRSIRYSLRRRDVFRTQLRALYRAAAETPLRIMFPLISGVAELREALGECARVRQELAAEGLAHDPDVPVGVMIETPSAALVADRLAGECAFLSIGTNDLIQYALAADRDNEDVGYLYHPLHPAILRLVKMVVDGARRHGTEVTMCGDMAGDPLYTWVLLGLGLRELSMAPQQIPVVKSIIRGTRLADAEKLAADALALDTEGDVEALVHGAMRARFPLELDVE